MYPISLSLRSCVYLSTLLVLLLFFIITGIYYVYTFVFYIYFTYISSFFLLSSLLYLIPSLYNLELSCTLCLSWFLSNRRALAYFTLFSFCL